MSSDWPIKTLDDVCAKITDGAHNSPKSVGNGKPMASVKDLTRFSIELKEARHISIEDFDKLVKQGCKPEIGDVLIAKDGNSALDTVCNVKQPLDAVLLSSVAILRPDPEKIDSDFLKYYFTSQDTINYLKNNFISGAAIPRVVLKDFKKAQIKLPPLEDQKNLSAVLGSFDDKIQLNRQINQTLEQMAQAIFKSWFVDFEPVKAKIRANEEWKSKNRELKGDNPELVKQRAQFINRAAMRTISGKTDEELDQAPPDQMAQLTATAALFPDELVDSEQGVIPKGWCQKALYETAEYINGAAFKSQDFSEVKEGLPIVKIAELKQGIIAQTKFTTGDFKEKYRINNGDVLYSWSGSPKTSLEVFKWFGGEGWLNQHIFKLNFDSNVHKYFTFYLLKQIKPLLIQTAQDKQTTGLGHITVADMKRIIVPFPDIPILSAFAQSVGPLFEEDSILQQHTAVLSQVRDALLPKLLSGQLAVPAKTNSQG